MDKVPVYIIILAIVGILIVGVIIASLSTNNEKSIQSKESETKSQNNCVLLKHHKNEDVVIIHSTLINNDCCLLCCGDFENSSLSIWDHNGNLVYNQIVNGSYGFVFYTNHELISQSFFKMSSIYTGQNVLKQKAINLGNYENFNDLKITINNYQNISTYVYGKNLNSQKGLKHMLDQRSMDRVLHLKDYDLSEYGITQYINHKFKNLRKVQPSRIKNAWEFVLDQNKNYILAYVKNVYNYDLNIGKSHITIYKNEEPYDLETSEFSGHDCNVVKVVNHEESIKSSDINSDFIDAIYSPIYFYNQFVYGKQKSYIPSYNRINHKVLIFEKI